MAVILIDPVFKTTKNYPQLCLEECKYMVKKLSSDYSDEQASNKE